MSRRKQAKALKELGETKILVDYLIAHNMDFDNENNFTDAMVEAAKEWYAYADTDDEWKFEEMMTVMEGMD